MIDLSYQASETGKQFHRSKSLFRGLRGPIGSGKSVTCCWELFRLAMTQQPNKDGIRRSRWAIIRETYPELESTTIKTWQDWFPPSICPIKRDFPITGRMQMPLEDGTTLDMEVVFLAVSREEDAKKLLSLELTGAWVNEAREIVYPIIQALMGRIGRFPAKRDGGHTRKAIIADTNPPDDDHWWFKLAEEGRLSDKDVLVTREQFEFFAQPPALIETPGGYKPNPHAENIGNLTDGYRYYLDQVAGKDPQWIKVYLLGQYGTIQNGKPVYGSTYNDLLHASKIMFEPIPKWPVVLAFDFGLTPACVFMQKTPRGQIRVIEEVIGEDCGIRQLTENLIVPMLRTRYARCPIFVTGDPAGVQRSQADETTCYDILKEVIGKLVMQIEPASTNDPEARLDSVKLLLTRLVDGQPAFQVGPEAPLLRKGFLGAYKYKQIAQGKTMTTPEKNMASHVHDSLQYGCLLFTQGLPLRDRSAGGYMNTRAADAVAGY